MKKKLLAVLVLVIVASMVLSGCSFLFAKRTATISFDSNGGSFVTPITARIGEEISPPIPPIREGYEFVGWYEDKTLKTEYVFTTMGEENRAVFAKWKKVTYTVTLHKNGGEGANLTSYNINEKVYLPTLTKEGYKFAGWYEDSEFTSNRVEFIDCKEGGDKEYYAKWVEGDYVVTLNGNGGTGTALDSYKAHHSVMLPTDWTKEGYIFRGWYEDAEFSGAPVDGITILDRGDKEFFAKWEAIKYTLSFITNGGSIVDDITAPYESEIVLPKPTKDSKVFAGWYEDDALTIEFDGTTMPLGNKILYAKWVDGFVITYMSDGVKVDEEAIFGNYIELKNPTDTSFNKPDYFFDGWYMDEGFTKLCTTTTEIKKATTLYAKWTHRSFLPYKDKFDYAVKNNRTVEIGSRREFIALVDYMMFTFTKGITFDLNYIANNETAIESEIKYAIINGVTATVLPYLNYYTNYGGGHARLELTDSSFNTGYTPIPGQQSGVLPKISQGLVPVYTPKRASNFDDFKYKDYTDSLEVDTSNELFYALQYGIKPIVKLGSDADKMMKEAKSILRSICDDSMTDFQKMYAIYCWFIKEVNYDNTAAKKGTGVPASQVAKYDAWQMEGVFNNRVAVCDGISKAVVALARIEGIPCIRVVSKNHAWNKVYLDVDGNGIKEWYGFDATWANTSTGENEVPSNVDFLFTDAYKESKSQISLNHQDIKAITPIDVYRELAFAPYTAENRWDYDLVVDGKSDVSRMIKMMSDYVNLPSNSRMTSIAIDIKTDKGYVGDLQSDIRDACSTYNGTFMKPNPNRDITLKGSLKADTNNPNRHVLIFDVA